MSDPRLLAHFERLHADSIDPWGYDTRWYEARKRALTLAMLPRQRYRHGFEPGCSIGALSAELIQRCDAFTGWDASPSAVASARRRLGHLDNARFEQRTLPTALPASTFDLIVFSEVGYYLQEPALVATIYNLQRALRPSGDLIACHWRHPLQDGYRSGDAVHERLHDCLELHAVSSLVERDFRIDLWSRDALDVGRWEALK
ncbi:class I SAM-dependent methyltransferase [Salinicola sp. CPA57]|uniref:SAM-dependent methyltransferase n=1 Tax=Salinicola sp. CPA57 TaxID=1949080 RepID=UPI0018E4E324|nr:class I SAM-dependent methyltransferase [Salinicola sp. CPA57]